MMNVLRALKSESAARKRERSCVLGLSAGTRYMRSEQHARGELRWTRGTGMGGEPWWVLPYLIVAGKTLLRTLSPRRVVLLMARES